MVSGSGRRSRIRTPSCGLSETSSSASTVGLILLATHPPSHNISFPLSNPPLPFSISLLEHGFPIVVHGLAEKSRGIALSGSMDLPAKADVQQFAHHNGHCGCPFCLNPGVSVATEGFKKTGHVHVYPCGTHPLRSTSHTIDAARKACVSGSPVDGVKSASILLTLPRFSVINSLPIDYMHSVCLGVAKRLTSLWFDPKFSSKPWYIGDRLDEIDQLFLSAQPSRHVKRLPRTLKDRKHWKGKYPPPSHSPPPFHSHLLIPLVFI